MSLAVLFSTEYTVFVELVPVKKRSDVGRELSIDGCHTAMAPIQEDQSQLH